MFLAKGTLAEIADRFGVTESNVSVIKRGESWRWLTAAYGDVDPPGPRHIDAERVTTIFKTTGTQAAIAARFNTTPSIVGAIKRRQTWRHITKDL